MSHGVNGTELLFCWCFLTHSTPRVTGTLCLLCDSCCGSGVFIHTSLLFKPCYACLFVPGFPSSSVSINLGLRLHWLWSEKATIYWTFYYLSCLIISHLRFRHSLWWHHMMFTFFWWMHLLDVVCAHVCALIWPVFHLAAATAWGWTNQLLGVNTTMWSLTCLSICVRLTCYLSFIYQLLPKFSILQDQFDQCGKVPF